MSTDRASNILLNSGKLILTPTDLNSANAGGTVLGICKSTLFEPNIVTGKVIAEEFANSTATAAYLGDSPVLLTILRSWDLDMLNTTFPGAVSGAIGGGLNTGNLKPGNSISPVKILFLPDDTTNGIYIYMAAAIPIIPSNLRMKNQLNEEIELGMAFEGTVENVTRKSFQMGTKAKITL